MLTRFSPRKNLLKMVIVGLATAVGVVAIHACSPQKTTQDAAEPPTQPPSQVAVPHPVENPQAPTPEVLMPSSSDGGTSAPPSPPPQVESEPDGLALYNRLCASCHGPMTRSSIKDATVEGIKGALQNQPLMRNLIVSESEIGKISEVLRAR